MPIKQDDRMLGITTALGAEALAVRSISVREELSRLFQIEAELFSEDGDIDLDKVVGHPATIRLNLGQDGKRYFNGCVSRLVQVANEGHYARYQATIVPWLWFLTRTADCRIFQEKTTPEIIEDVFKAHGFNNYQLKLSTTYPKREYCVQYRETDFNFVSRLMEQEGIYYFFEHENGKHTLVLADSISAHKPFPDYAEVTFHELQEGAAEDREVITDWTIKKEVQAVACTLNDFDFKKPKASLRASSNVTRQYGKAEYEIYDYPGEYLETSEGERLADVRLNERQTQYEALRGEGSARGLVAGCTFKLKSHPRADQNREYLITGVSITADSGPFDSTSGEESFSCALSAVDKSQQFRPDRLTPEPVIQGLQTAIVVGPKGEEIHTDPQARVKVQFHWDRYGKLDENSSCWIRVSQPWAGKGWGSMATPRIGQEVIVEFLEGDPDRPLITGRVYNADQKPPYAGGMGVVSGLKSNTHKGKGFNEMSMDDTAGKEKITIHSQYDMNTTVEHDQTDIVHNKRTTTVDVDDKETVGNNQAISIAAKQKIAVGADQETTVGANQKLTVTSDQTNAIGATQKTTVGGNQETKVGGKQNTTIGADQTDAIATDRKTTVGGSDKLDVSSSIEITSGASITLKVGGSSIMIAPGGVTITSSGIITLQASLIKNNT